MTNKDLEILKKLGGKFAAICSSKENKEKKRHITALNSLKADRPIVYASPEGAWKELIPESSLECEDKLAREWEKYLKQNIYTAEILKDDTAFEPFINIHWRAEKDDFGFRVKYEHGGNGGSYVWEAPIKDLEKGLKEIKPRQYKVDKKRFMRSWRLQKKYLTVYWE